MTFWGTIPFLSIQNLTSLHTHTVSHLHTVILIMINMLTHSHTHLCTYPPTSSITHWLIHPPAHTYTFPSLPHQFTHWHLSIHTSFARSSTLSFMLDSFTCSHSLLYPVTRSIINWLTICPRTYSPACSRNSSLPRLPSVSASLTRPLPSHHRC